MKSQKQKRSSTKKISQKLKALGNETRLALLGLIYLREETSFSDIQKETEIESNKLSYHVNILKNAGLIKYFKNGYLVTNEGEKILRDLGFLKTVERIRRENERINEEVTKHVESDELNYYWKDKITLVPASRLHELTHINYFSKSDYTRKKINLNKIFNYNFLMGEIDRHINNEIRDTISSKDISQKYKVLELDIRKNYDRTWKNCQVRSEIND